MVHDKMLNVMANKSLCFNVRISIWARSEMQFKSTLEYQFKTVHAIFINTQKICDFVGYDE